MHICDERASNLKNFSLSKNKFKNYLSSRYHSLAVDAILSIMRLQK